MHIRSTRYSLNVSVSESSTWLCKPVPGPGRFQTNKIKRMHLFETKLSKMTLWARWAFVTGGTSAHPSMNTERQKVGGGVRNSPSVLG